MSFGINKHYTMYVTSLCRNCMCICHHMYESIMVILTIHHRKNWTPLVHSTCNDFIFRKTLMKNYRFSCLLSLCCERCLARIVYLVGRAFSYHLRTMLFHVNNFINVFSDLFEVYDYWNGKEDMYCYIDL